MDADLKRKLRDQIDTIAPEYGLDDLVYPSFVKSFGFRSQPLCAADVVESISALMQAASGIRLQVESLDGQGGGEWFAGARVWDLGDKTVAKEDAMLSTRNRTLDSENTSPVGQLDGADGSSASMGRWWVKNFWIAFDALGSE